MKKILQLLFFLQFILLGSILADENIATYVISPQDDLTVEIWNKYEFTRTITVREDGYISFTPLGEILAAGKTPSQLSKEIAQQLEVYLEKPIVTILIRKAKGYKITILGAVNKPGEYNFQEKVTLLEVIGKAGGLTFLADESQSVKIVRKDTSIAVPLNTLIKAEKVQDNIILKNNDIIIVLENLEKFLDKVKDSKATINIFINKSTETNQIINKIEY